MDNGQAHTGTREFSCAMQALEHTEQLARILHVKARPIIRDTIDSVNNFNAL